ncbi:MAG: hypothetical protein AAFQ34_16165, partial [Pseudomonadota bacterium]
MTTPQQRRQQRRYPMPFAGAQVRRTIGLFLDILQRLQLTLLLGSGGFDLGVDLGQHHEEQAAAGTLSVAGRSLRILQGTAAALHVSWHVPAGKQPW